MGKTVSRTKEERRRNTSFRERKWWTGFWVSPDKREEENALAWTCMGSFILSAETGGRAAVLAVSYDKKRAERSGETTVALEGSWAELIRRIHIGRRKEETGRNMNFGRPLWDTLEMANTRHSCLFYRIDYALFSSEYRSGFRTLLKTAL